MKVSQAIESLEKILAEPLYHCIAGDVDAVKLGIEALKRIKGRRDLKTGWEATPLPGETPEEEP